MPGRDKCAPPLEFLGETITRCEFDWEKFRMDDKWYNPHWVIYNHTEVISKPFANAFIYQSAMKAKVFSKYGMLSKRFKGLET